MPLNYEQMSHTWRSINAQWHRHVHELLVNNDLTHVDRMVLLAVEQLGSPTKSAIAASINVQPQNLTRSLQRLDSKGLIDKAISTTDKRFAHFQLTKQSKTIVTKLINQNKELWQLATQGLTQTEVKAFTHAMTQLLSNLEGN